MASTETGGDAVAVAILNEVSSVQGAGMGQFSLLSFVSANSAVKLFWGVFTYCTQHIVLVLPCGKYLQMKYILVSTT
jgi:hypothetical protein